MNWILKLRNELKKTQKAVKSEVASTKRLQKEFYNYHKSKGVFELQDIFYMFIFGIMIYVFTMIWNPILAIFNFTGIAYGGILELILNMFVLIIVGGYLASMIKKWQTPSM